MLYRCHYFHFNSIKVRLELRFPLSARRYEEFQFHKGTIRTALSATLQNTLANFNSIKVRLEQALQALPLMAITFQFHKGTIRTSTNSPACDVMSHFNSIKVRLERTMHFEFTDINIISIP